MWGFRHKGAAPHSSFCECRFHTPQAWPRSLTWLAKSHREGSHVGRNRSLGNGGKRKHRQVLQVWLVIVPNHNIHHCCYYHSLFMFMMNIHHGSWPFEAAYMKVSFITGVTSISKIRPWLVLKAMLKAIPFSPINPPCVCQSLLWFHVGSSSIHHGESGRLSHSSTSLYFSHRETQWDRPRRSRDPILNNSSSVRMDPTAGHVLEYALFKEYVWMHR